MLAIGFLAPTVYQLTPNGTQHRELGAGADATICENTCEFAYDGVLHGDRYCDDGGPASKLDVCAYGTESPGCTRCRINLEPEPLTVASPCYTQHVTRAEALRAAPEPGMGSSEAWLGLKGIGAA